MRDTAAETRLAAKAARLERLARGFREGGSHREAGECAQRAADIRYALAEMARLAKYAADMQANALEGYRLSLIVAPITGKGPPIPKAMHAAARAYQKLMAFEMSRHSPDDLNRRKAP